jgi:DNA-binding LacI/PurR family transcriptional regulator
VGNRVTLKTVAEAVGVSRTTVSNAYNRPDQLAPELRDRILGTARRLGYPGPDPAARRLRSGRRDTVGLLLTAGLSYAFADPAAVMLLQGIARATEAAGLAMLVVPDRDHGVQDAVVDAFCLCSMAAGHPSVTAAQERGVPLVVVDAPRLSGHAYVGIEDRLGARLVAEHLLELGHRRFALLTERAQLDVGLERLSGYRDAFAAAGLDWDAVPRFVTERAFEGGRLALEGTERPTAVIAATDQLALGVIEAAHEAGLRVPDDLSVVGFDDIPAAGWSRPGLTTVRQPLVEKGEIAGRLLSGRATDREVILPVELVVRGSTAKA